MSWAVQQGPFGWEINWGCGKIVRPDAWGKVRTGVQIEVRQLVEIIRACHKIRDGQPSPRRFGHCFSPRRRELCELYAKALNEAKVEP